MLGRPQCAHLGLAGGRTHKGRKLVVCLLDRQPVIPEIADCDRYEPALPKTLQ